MTSPKKKLNWRFRRKLSETERASRVATGREIEEYLLYLRSPWRVMAVNFFAGMMRGLGAAVGATAVIAFSVWIIAKAVSLPVIGEYFTDVRDKIDELVEEAQISDDLRRVEFILRRIEANTSESLALQEVVANTDVTNEQTADSSEQ